MVSARALLSLRWMKRVQFRSRTHHVILGVKIHVTQCGGACVAQRWAAWTGGLALAPTGCVMLGKMLNLWCFISS